MQDRGANTLPIVWGWLPIVIVCGAMTQGIEGDTMKVALYVVLAVGLFSALGGRVYLISSDGETKRELVSYLTDKYQEATHR